MTTFTCDATAHCCAPMGAWRIVVGDVPGRVHFVSLELKEHHWVDTHSLPRPLTSRFGQITVANSPSHNQSANRSSLTPQGLAASAFAEAAALNLVFPTSPSMASRKQITFITLDGAEERVWGAPRIHSEPLGINIAESNTDK